MKDALGIGGRSHELYNLPATGTRKKDLGRTNYNLFVKPAHEVLIKDVETDDSIRAKLERIRADNMLPPAYTEHPIVQDNPPVTVSFQ